MKRLIPYICAFAFSNLLAADAAKEEAPNAELIAAYNHVDRAKFKKTHSQRHHHFSFSEGYVLGSYEHAISSKTDLQLGVGYMNTEYSFSHHPKETSFRQQHFHNVLIQGGATTHEIERWRWDGGLGLQMNTNNFSLSRYTYFSGVLHGKYDFKEHTNLHVGIIGYSGMRFTRVLPIIGFDYEFSKKLKLNAVFPIDMTLIYSIDDHWSVDAAIRYVLSRQRLNDHGHYPRGLVAYRNWGTEAGVTYALNPRCKLNLHIGETFGGRMRLSDHHDRHRKHLKLDSSLYYGFEATFAF